MKSGVKHSREVFSTGDGVGWGRGLRIGEEVSCRAGLFPWKCLFDVTQRV